MASKPPFPSLSCPGFVIALALLGAHASHADYAQSPIDHSSIGAVVLAETDHETTGTRVCPDASVIVSKARVDNKITVPNAAFGGIPVALLKTLVASFGSFQCGGKEGTAKSKVVESCAASAEAAHDHKLVDATFSVTYDGFEQKNTMSEHKKKDAECPPAVGQTGKGYQSGFYVPPGNSSSYEHLLGDTTTLLRLTTEFSNIDDESAQYTYTVENLSADGMDVVWKSVRTQSHPQGWTVRVEASETEVLQVTAPIASASSNEDVAEFEIDPSAEVSGQFPAPAIIPGTHVPALGSRTRLVTTALLLAAGTALLLLRRQSVA